MKYVVIIFGVLIMVYIGAMLIFRLGGFCKQYASVQDTHTKLESLSRGSAKTWLEVTGICSKSSEPVVVPVGL